MTFAQSVGLTLLIATTAITVGILLYDAVLGISGKQTISEGVWADLKQWHEGYGAFPLRAVYLPALMLFGPVGMVIHFFC